MTNENVHLAGPEQVVTTSDSSSLPEDALIIVPVRNAVLFPGTILPISVGRERSIAGAQEALQTERPVGMLMQQDPAVEEPQGADLYGIGTVASVLRYVTDSDGTHHLIARGDRRFRVLDFLPGFPYLVARVEYLHDDEHQSSKIEAREAYLRQKALEAFELLPQVPAELVSAVRQSMTPGRLADMVAGFIDSAPQEKQAVLESLDVQTRLDEVIAQLNKRLDVLRLTHELDKQTKEKMTAQQREYMLREQLKTIQRELGDEDAAAGELDDLEKAIIDAQMPEAVEREVRKEFKRLQRMNEAASEHAMLRTWLEWMVALPWSKLGEESIDIETARHILDEDHHGLEKVKRRILEFLAVRKLNPNGRSPILCLVGPPGVGKTSLGKSIARSVGLEFVRASLGGVHDEAEIRGHRRTYVGALPGSIVQAIRRAGSRNPVFMLDEMDKLGAGVHGDPASALLEVLDPEQNSTFRDNYLGVDLDLSRVLFIATANVLDAIPGPLRDRMEVIEIPGYTDEEKLEIAQRYLVPRQLEQNGIDSTALSLQTDALATIIGDYTREAGVRNLEREIGAVIRHSAIKIASGLSSRIDIAGADLAEILGPARFESEIAMRTSVPGVATGLAWTPVGGDILFIEAAKTPGNGQLILTGQLG